jgi:hypothetical protein
MFVPISLTAVTGSPSGRSPALGLRDKPADPKNPDPGDVNLTTRAGFGEYSYDSILEVASNPRYSHLATISRTEPERQCIHLIDPPTTGTSLKVRDNGYEVRRVRDLCAGKRFDFGQSGGTLTIDGITAWDPYDTVFTVETDDRCRTPVDAQPGRTVTPGCRGRAGRHVPVRHVSSGRSSRQGGRRQWTTAGRTSLTTR